MKRKRHRKLLFRVIAFLLCTGLFLSFGKMNVHAETDSGIPILYKGGIHYIEDPKYPDNWIVLFCMNNLRHWPHHTDQMGDVQVPNYVEGYLTPEHFQTPEDYGRCLNQLANLLYAGYPYNGKGLYKIVGNSELYVPTEEEFDVMLRMPVTLQRAFPELGHHVFTYQDWVNSDAEHMGLLAEFIKDVGRLYPDQQTETGLSYAEIAATPFYKAVTCMLNATQETPPRQLYSVFYGGSYFVTAAQAYDATQFAVWRLLQSYGIEDNNMGDLSMTELGEVLYAHKDENLLKNEPLREQLQLTGSLEFHYNPSDGRWHSGKLKIVEPPEYHGIYYLELPEGMTASCDNLSFVYGNEEYELISDRKPDPNALIGIRGEFLWMKDMRQYAPAEDVMVDGKRFQNMIGVVIDKKILEGQVPITVQDKGSLTLSKEVTGEMGDLTKAFTFTIQIKDEKGIPVNESFPYVGGVKDGYEQVATKPDDGILTFVNGSAEVMLSHGQQITLQGLPVLGTYVVQEKEADQDFYSTTYNGKKEIMETPLVEENVVAVVNNKEYVPDTGIQDSGTKGMFILSILSLLAVGSFFVLDGWRRKRGRKE